jgi:hypothetical protein
MTTKASRGKKMDSDIKYAICYKVFSPGPLCQNSLFGSTVGNVDFNSENIVSYLINNF